ncbi:MAG TPA: adenosine kinase [Acidimicrobiales bacterium]|nr:adenosine kinase [Acidimicrobiales bacterium]
MPEDPKLDVAAVGNAIVDVLCHVPDGFVEELGLQRGVMQLVDEAAAQRIYDRMPPGREVSGGSAANTAAGIASFGGRAAFVGKIRDDQLGEVFRHDIRAAGVRFDVPPAHDGPPTARCLVLVTGDGHRTMNTYLGAAGAITADDVEGCRGLFEAASVTYLEGYLWDDDRAKGAMLRAIEIAKTGGRRVAMTLSDPFCVDRHRDDFLRLVDADVDVLFANEDEVVSLFQAASFDDALQAMRRHRCEYAALTRSEKGAVVVKGDEFHVIDAAPVDGVVDTTGAGDLYAAGFLFGLTSGFDVATCGRLGALAAAEVISHLGARPERDLAQLATAAGLTS